ncbi:MAG: MerR family transcriptional regulator [Rhizomicrobium sp.]
MSSPAVASAPRTKSPEAFRTISEVAVELDMPQHVLRFWETRFAQIKPIKRAGGRRFYRPEDLDLLRGIKSLLYFEGYTIKGVQKVLRDRGIRYVAEIGRGKLAGFGAPASIPVIEEGDDNSPATTALATLARMHAEASTALDEQRRVDLELLLAELQQMKARLRKARAGVAA